MLKKVPPHRIGKISNLCSSYRKFGLFGKLCCLKGREEWERDINSSCRKTSLTDSSRGSLLSAAKKKEAFGNGKTRRRRRCSPPSAPLTVEQTMATNLPMNALHNTHFASTCKKVRLLFSLTGEALSPFHLITFSREQSHLPVAGCRRRPSGADDDTRPRGGSERCTYAFVIQHRGRKCEEKQDVEKEEAGCRVVAIVCSSSSATSVIRCPDAVNSFRYLLLPLPSLALLPSFPHLFLFRGISELRDEGLLSRHA